MRLIGIHGLKTSGKDSTAALIQELRPNVQRAAFADKLKEIAALTLGYKDDLIGAMDQFKSHGKLHVSGIVETDRDITGRQYLQYLGAHAREVFGDTFWIDQVLPRDCYQDEDWDHLVQMEIQKEDDERLERMYPDADIVIITDVRYENEAERVKDLGGEIWEVLRPGTASDGHSSETPLPRIYIDKTIDNKSDLNWLKAAVEGAL